MQMCNLLSYFPCMVLLLLLLLFLAGFCVNSDSSLILRRVHAHSLLRLRPLLLLRSLFRSLPFGGLLRLFISDLPRAVSLLLFSLQKKCWKGGKGQEGRMSYPRNCWWCFFSLSLFYLLLIRSSFLFSCSFERNSSLCVILSLSLSLCPFSSFS